jgi:hypothetical protein
VRRLDATLDVAREIAALPGTGHRPAQLQRTVAVLADLAVEDQERRPDDSLEAGPCRAQRCERLLEEALGAGQVDVAVDDRTVRSGMVRSSIPYIG